MYNSPDKIALTTAGICSHADRYLLGQRAFGGEIGGKWEFPGGKVRATESPPEALSREFKEELGTEIDVGSYIGSVRFRHGEKPYEVRVYEVSLESGRPRPLVHRQIAWFSIAEIDKLDLADSDRRILSLLSGQER